MAQKKSNRHPPEPKGVETDTHTPLFPVENRDKRLLTYVLNLNNERLNVKAYSRENKLARSTTYDIINRLISTGYLIKRGIGDFTITQKGKLYLGVSVRGVGRPRRGCRKKANLSLHYKRYILLLSKNKYFSVKRLNKLNPLNIKTINLPNFTQYLAYFEDATLIINPKHVAIRIHDIIAEDTEAGHYEALSKALYYSKLVENAGLIGHSIRLETSHYARIESILSETLHKIDNRYYLNLGKGRKFWIDHSAGKREDETNDYQFRERLDQWIKDLSDSSAIMSDVDKMKEVVGSLIKLELIKKQMPHHNGHLPKEEALYIG